MEADVSEAQVRLERDGALAWLIFDNPARRNAVTAPMLAGTLSALHEAEADDAVRVVILRGAGEQAFVSGADISAFGSDDGVDRGGTGPVEITEAMASMAKPVIAALRGWCLGAGAMLAFAADVRVAGDDLRIGVPAAKLGVAYPREGVERMVALGGPAVASELLLTGEPYDAASALRAGLVNRVVPAAVLFEEAAALAALLAGNAPLTMRASKLAIAGDAAADEVIAACFRSEDFAEGQRAFAEKRRPAFRGR